MAPSSTQIHRRFHEDGSLRGEWTTVDGKKEGFARIWHKNGLLSSEATFVDGLAQGVIREWNEDGRLTLQAHVVNGQYEGSYEAWFDDGKVLRKGIKYMDKSLPGFIEYRADGSVLYVVE
jgi:antitoxin component YwqK of YwqJK toxin-antitoxin module